MDEISSAANSFVSPLYSALIIGLSWGPLTTSNGHSLISFCTVWSEKLRPISLFASYIVFLGFLELIFFAASPTRRSSFVKATYDGVVLNPWSFAIISTLLLFKIPTQLYVVPKSIPIVVI